MTRNKNDDLVKEDDQDGFNPMIEEENKKIQKKQLIF